MASLDPVSSALTPVPGQLLAPGAGADSPLAPSSAPNGFGSMLDGLISAVDAKQATAEQATNQVLLGNSSQLHQSVIAMQEATTALSLMVQVRNNLVASYQELMRMQV